MRSVPAPSSAVPRPRERLAPGPKDGACRLLRESVRESVAELARLLDDVRPLIVDARQQGERPRFLLLDREAFDAVAACKRTDRERGSKDRAIGAFSGRPSRSRKIRTARREASARSPRAGGAARARWKAPGARARWREPKRQWAPSMAGIEAAARERGRTRPRARCASVPA